MRRDQLLFAPRRQRLDLGVHALVHRIAEQLLERCRRRRA